MKGNKLKTFLRLKEKVALKDYTTFKTGGFVKYFLEAKKREEIFEAVKISLLTETPWFLLGKGSNLLISDKNLDILTIKIETRGIEFQKRNNKVLLLAEAGEDWDNLVKKVVEKKLWGIENLSGIPGSVGAAPVQNIGAYGQEIKEVIEWVEVFDTKTFKIKKLSNSECKFGYRESIFKKRKNLIILRVALNLKTKGKAFVDYKDIKNYLKENKIKKLSPKKMRQIILKIRKKKFPDLKKFGTAGSFFKNPIVDAQKLKELLLEFPALPYYHLEKNQFKIPIAWVLDKVLNLRGFRSGQVGLFENQPLVVVNFGKAKGEEIKTFIDSVKKLVKEKTGLELEEEVQLVGL